MIKAFITLYQFLQSADIDVSLLTIEIKCKNRDVEKRLHKATEHEFASRDNLSSEAPMFMREFHICGIKIRTSSE